MTHLVTLSKTNTSVEKPLALHRSSKVYVYMVSKIFKLFNLMSFFCLYFTSLNAVIVTKSLTTPHPYFWNSLHYSMMFSSIYQWIVIRSIV